MQTSTAMTTDRKTHGQTLTDRTILYVTATDVEAEVRPTTPLSPWKSNFIYKRDLGLAGTL